MEHRDPINIRNAMIRSDYLRWHRPKATQEHRDKEDLEHREIIKRQMLFSKVCGIAYELMRKAGICKDIANNIMQRLYHIPPPAAAA